METAISMTLSEERRDMLIDVILPLAEGGGGADGQWYPGHYHAQKMNQHVVNVRRSIGSIHYIHEISLPLHPHS
jgi:hypothetical protein